MLRETTERPEGIAAGNACLVGSDRSSIADQTSDLLTNRQRYEQMARANNPYGDGQAAGRIVQAVLES